MKRKFWWELIFISVLLFLLAGAQSQRKRQVVAMVPVALLPALELGAVTVPLPPPLTLQ